MHLVPTTYNTVIHQSRKRNIEHIMLVAEDLKSCQVQTSDIDNIYLQLRKVFRTVIEKKRDDGFHCIRKKEMVE